MAWSEWTVAREEEKLKLTVYFEREGIEFE